MIARQNRRPEQRTIPMSPTVVNTLREWKLSCPKSELNLVFPNTAGKVEWLASINYRVWRPLLRKIGLVDQGRRAAVQFSPGPLSADLDTRYEPFCGIAMDRAWVQFQASTGAAGTFVDSDDL